MLYIKLTKRRIVLFILLLLIVFCTIVYSKSASTAVDARDANEGQIDRTVSFSVIMYHLVNSDETAVNDYVITPQQLESDLIYLKENGYETVSVSDLVRYINDPAATLPDKPILLTFDDGYYNNYLNVFPLLKKYDAKCVLSIIGKYTERDDTLNQVEAYSHVSWAQLKEMADSGYVEIGNHTYDLHSNDTQRGVLAIWNDDTAQFETSLCNDVLKLQELIFSNTGCLPITFAYPFGQSNAYTEEVMRNLGFLCTLSCEEGINHIEKGGDLYYLKRYNRPHGPNSEAFFSGKLP
jgi:peptidoglycan/xylan/chitin deacetylase (PgdA/CDA1 family)